MPLLDDKHHPFTEQEHERLLLHQPARFQRYGGELSSDYSEYCRKWHKKRVPKTYQPLRKHQFDWYKAHYPIMFYPHGPISSVYTGYLKQHTANPGLADRIKLAPDKFGLTLDQTAFSDVKHSREFSSNPAPGLPPFFGINFTDCIPRDPSEICHASDYYPINHQETPAMRSIKIEHKTFVNGVDAKTIGDDDLYALIRNGELEIERLNGLKNKPKRLQARIDELQAGIDALVALVDKA